MWEHYENLSIKWVCQIKIDVVDWYRYCYQYLDITQYQKWYRSIEYSGIISPITNMKQ